MQRLLPVSLMLLGALEALLVARLLLRLFAARPDNPVFAAFFALTEPLRMPLLALDAAQPRFGAVLELSTLVLCVVVGMLVLAIALLLRVRPPKQAT